MANAIVRGKEEDQPQPLALGAPEDQCVQLEPMREPGKHSGSVSSACSCQGLAEPCPLRVLLCVPGGCSVRACSPGHAHCAHHLCVVFTAPCAPGVCSACRVSSSASSIPPGASHHTRVCLAPTSWDCCAPALAQPSLAVQSPDVLLSLLPPCLACRHA